MPRNTDPTRPTVLLVRTRDKGCVVCGSHWSPTTQHRNSRGMGGTLSDAINRPSNLIVLCGSGTTGCHGWVEDHPMFSREAGWALRSTDNPLEHPVLYLDGWFYLDDLGQRIPDPITAELRGGRRRRGGGSGGGSVPVNDPDVGGSWPPDKAREAAAQDALRPWGSPRGR